MSKIQMAARIYKKDGAFYLVKTTCRYVISGTIGRTYHYLCVMIRTALNKLGFEIETKRKMEFEIRMRRTIPKVLGLNETDKYFIEFMSQKRNHPYKEIEAVFLETRDRFPFLSDEYEELLHNIFYLYKIYHDLSAADEGEMIDSYKFHEFALLLRHMSGSYNDIMGYSDRLLSSYSDEILNAIGSYLVTKGDKPLVIVDYGCGLAYTPRAIARRVRNSKVYLVDIDALPLEFAKFLCDKQKITSDVIPVSKSDPYPKLPKHDICICISVWEHLHQPMEAYKNIYESLEEGGVLYTFFADTEKGPGHPNWDLRELRELASRDYEQVSGSCFRKIRQRSIVSLADSK